MPVFFSRSPGLVYNRNDAFSYVRTVDAEETGPGIVHTVNWDHCFQWDFSLFRTS